jgi:arabinan endo-1,5-alpha-L-arabinosidase
MRDRMSRWSVAVAAAVALVAGAACTNTGGGTTPPPPPEATTTTRSPSSPPPPASGLPAGSWALTGDVGVHDPSIVREGKDWYVFSTGQGIQVLRSTNGGTNWVRAPQIFLSPPSWWKSAVPGQKHLDVWAPDATVHNGRVWLYYAISTFGSRQSAIGLASASAIGAGSWRDEGMVMRSSDANDYNAIDPDLVIDAQGQPWLAFGSFWSGLKIVQLGSNMKPTGAIRGIATRSNGIEAASIARHNGWYYLFASIDKCCQGVNSTYKVVVGRSQSVTGPYVDRNGKSMASGGGTVLDAGNSRWKGPGGEDVWNGQVIARHAYDATANGAAKLLISTLRWDGDWPGY